MNTYHEQHYLTPFWEGSVIYHEAICFRKDMNGEVVSGSLLYTPTTILGVRSADLTILYEEGKDYRVEGRRLILLPNSRIDIMPYDVYMPPYLSGKEVDWLANAEDSTRYIGLTLDVVTRYQVAVSYEHAGLWCETIPQSQLSRLPHTKKALENRLPLRIAFYGDSITAGYEASGVNERVIDMPTVTECTLMSSRAPYMPNWAEMVCRQLRFFYNHSEIIKVNRAAGGATTSWGIEHVDKLVNPFSPDLVILGFGMNQSSVSGEAFSKDIREIMQRIRSVHPLTEFLLLGCMVANAETVAFCNNRLEEQEQSLYKLMYESGGVGVAPVNQVFRALLKAGKQYTDLTGNNFNHPNDFSIRIYAQTILACLKE